MSMKTGQRDPQHFLNATPWRGATVTPLQADASTRSYARLDGGPSPALLMDAPPASEAPACPPGASHEERKALGYNAMARLAGPRLEAFTALAEWLKAQGVPAPTVYANDPSTGFAVIEDFGDQLLAQAVAHQDEAALYHGAIQLLRPLRQAKVAPGLIGAWPLQTYDELVLQTEAALLIEWYTAYRGVELSPEAKAAWTAAWDRVLPQLSAPSTLVLRDYHAENILVGNDARMAVIDFQDALIGQAAYDAVSLIEDARRDVDLGLAKELFEEDRLTSVDPVAYTKDYAILAAQRNAKILGIFARLINRDGKEKYRQFFSRVEAHFARDLDRPAVLPVRQWAEQYMPMLLSDGGGRS